MATSIDLPQNTVEWQEAYAIRTNNDREGLQAIVSAGGRRVSGSEFGHGHFLCLRAIRENYNTGDFQPKDLLMDDAWEKARLRFQQDKEWKAFLENIETDMDGHRLRYQRSALDLVRYYQNKINKKDDTGLSDASSDADMQSNILISPQSSPPVPQHSATRHSPDSGSDSGTSKFSDQDSPSRRRSQREQVASIPSQPSLSDTRSPAAGLSQPSMSDTRSPAAGLSQPSMSGTRSPAARLSQPSLSDTRSPAARLGQPSLSDTRSPAAGLGQPFTPLMQMSGYDGRVMSSAVPLPKNFADPAADEQLVNVALDSFLNVLSFTEPRLTAQWTLRRAAFKIENIYEARVDGYLQHKNGAALILIEVKPYLRSKNEPKVQMQETAQVAAWIYQAQGKGAKKLENGRYRYHHIAQDHREIYLTIAEYGDAYLRYLKQSADPEAVRIDDIKSTDEESFLLMKQYGPFDRHKKGHMSKFGPFVYALTKELGQLHIDAT